MIVPARKKRPPASAVPPITTARIASSSIQSPALFPSAPDTIELIISPAMPAQSAENTYARMISPRDRTPASRLASLLPPTASISMPSAVRRVTSAVTTKTPATMKIEKGRANR